MVLCVVGCDVSHGELLFDLLQPDTRVIGPEHRQLQTDGMCIGRIHCSRNALRSSWLNRYTQQAAHLSALVTVEWLQFTGCTVQRRHVRNVDIMYVTVQFVKVLQYIYVQYTKIRLGNARVTNVLNTKLTKFKFILNTGRSMVRVPLR